MKDNEVKDKVIYLQQQIAKLIATRKLLDDREKEKMLRNIENLMQQSNTDVTELLEDEIQKIYSDELDQALRELEKRGEEFKTDLNSQVHSRALENILADSTEDLNAAYREANKRLIKNIDETLDQVKQEIADGVMYGNTRRKTVKRVYDDFLNKGLTSFTTVDGKELPLDFYAETVTRTKTSTASIQAHANTYEEAGVNLVEVVGASDPCNECAPYQNVVFSVDGKDDRFPHENVKDLFPLHPNCRCNVLPYVLEYEERESVDDKIQKGKAFDPTKDTRTAKQKKEYDDIQRRRRNARQEMKQYDKIKSVLGDDAPKSLGAYRRMKNNKTKGYNEIQAKMRALSKKGG